MQEIRTRVAEELSDARRGRRARVPTSPTRRTLTRRRHVIAWREDEHRDTVSTPTRLSVLTNPYKPSISMEMKWKILDSPINSSTVARFRFLSKVS